MPLENRGFWGVLMVGAALFGDKCSPASSGDVRYAIACRNSVSHGFTKMKRI
jgi:hypothetical protein